MESRSKLETRRKDFTGHMGGGLAGDSQTRAPTGSVKPQCRGRPGGAAETCEDADVALGSSTRRAGKATTEPQEKTETDLGRGTKA